MTAIERACKYFNACPESSRAVRGSKNAKQAWRRLPLAMQAEFIERVSLLTGPPLPRKVWAQLPRCFMRYRKCGCRWEALTFVQRRAIERSPEFRAWLEKTWKRATQEPRKAAQ